MAGTVKRFPDAAMRDAAGNKLKVPHMGWNNVRQAMHHPLWAGIEDSARFYFVHSYFAVPANSAVVAGESSYPFPFTCAVARDNLFAVQQFHPEKKSAAAGLRLLKKLRVLGRQSEVTMLIIPAIDLKDGQCVRLKQGEMDSATVFSSIRPTWPESGWPAAPTPASWWT